MSRLTIETRLNLLIGALLVLALAANVLITVLSAGPRIKAENASMVNLARDAIERALTEMQDSANPQRDLARLVERLSGIRHVTISLEGGSAPLDAGGVMATADPPAALVRILSPLFGADTAAVSIPAVISGTPYGRLVIRAEPGDELGEIAKTLSDLLTGGLLVILAMFVLTRIAVRQALKPIAALSGALSRLESGNFAVAVPGDGTPEFQEITAKVNDLARSLSQAEDENRRLSQELVSLEDQERRELAAELHDEFGPYLFAIRANATSLLSDAAAAGADASERRTRACRSLLGHVEAVQQANRRVLHRLRPPALSEIGLERAIEGLVASWRESHPGVAITTTIKLPDRRIGETAELTVYRVIQEGLTNAFRHAGASLIEIAVGSMATDRLMVSVADNGSGRVDDLKPGFGLSGMRDRVVALGGRLDVTPNGPGGGVRLAIELPVG